MSQLKVRNGTFHLPVLFLFLERAIKKSLVFFVSRWFFVSARQIENALKAQNLREDGFGIVSRD